MKVRLTWAWLGFRPKLFLTTAGVAVVAVAIVSVLIAGRVRRETNARIERGLIVDARLVTELLPRAGGTDLQREAINLHTDTGARVTLIGPSGRVLADSSEDAPGVARMENHAHRPEVVEARDHGVGVSVRFSATLGQDMLYVAVPVQHPTVAVVRLALPLTEVAAQQRSILRATAIALAVALVAAFALAWLASRLLARRLGRLAAGAQRFARGDGSALVTDAGGDEIGTLASAFNEAVVELGRRASELARDRARMAAILRDMVEGVVVLDAGGRIQLLNDAAQRLLQVDRAAIGRHYVEAIREPALLHEIETALRGEQTVAVEVSVASAPDLVFAATAAPVGREVAGGAIAVLHDITGLRRADRVRRDFVANVSHELRTPLTAIRGYLEALTDEPVDRVERAHFLEIISHHASRMERLVNDLLRLARLDAGEEPATIQPVSSVEIFRAVVRDLQRPIEAKEQRVEIDVEPSAETIEADPVMLQDALRNLIENAVNYAPVGTRIMLGAAVDHRRVVIAVEDEGPGIPEVHLARIFERFYRVDKARSREAGGTGLGLSIVKHLVERMHGSVEASNRPSGGARFAISLPQR